MGALADCESVLGGLWGQPVNTATTVALIAGGAVLAIRAPRMRWVGYALAATGAGSFLFHGPMPPGSQWAHDVTLAWVLLVMATWDTPAERAGRLPGLALLAVAFAIAPAAGDPVSAILAVAAVGRLLARDRSIGTLGPAALAGTTALVGRLGATGGPLCNPDSLLQPHALWHLGAAAAVTWWGLSASAGDDLQGLP